MIDALKHQAKLLKRATGVTHSAALDALAQQQGFKNWALLMKAKGKSK